MGVDVDKAGGDDQAGRIDGLAGAFRQITHRDDAAVANADVAAIGGHPGAVYDRAVLY